MDLEVKADDQKKVHKYLFIISNATQTMEIGISVSDVITRDIMFQEDMVHYKFTFSP